MSKIPENYNRNSAYIASTRNNYIKGLAVLWLQTHAPDVWQTIQDEAYTKYPSRVGPHSKKSIELPAALRKRRK